MPGDDHIKAGDEGGEIYGDNYILEHSSSVGDDRIKGGNGADFIVGDNAGLYSGSSSVGDDRIKGGDGTDFIVGDNGDLYFSSSFGDDRIKGGDGADRIYGDNYRVSQNSSTVGHDHIEGGGGADVIVGDNADLYYGSSSVGHDILIGGADNDQLWGDSRYIDESSTSTGNDLFIYDFSGALSSLTSADGHDQIMDFNVAEDRLRFQSEAFTEEASINAALFKAETGDFDGVQGVDTRIILASEPGVPQETPTWSVTLSGVDMAWGDLQQYVDFGIPTTAEDWSLMGDTWALTA